jgi:hypothetical protein
MLHRILNILLAASDVQANSLRGGLISVLAASDVQANSLRGGLISVLAASDVRANSLRGGLILVLARTDTDWFNTVYRPSKITVKHIRVGNSVVEP